MYAKVIVNRFSNYTSGLRFNHMSMKRVHRYINSVRNFHLENPKKSLNMSRIEWENSLDVLVLCKNNNQYDDDDPCLGDLKFKLHATTIFNKVFYVFF